MGAGALVSALVVATFQRPRVRVLLGGGMVLGVAELVLATTASFPVSMVAVFFAGVGAISTAATANSLIQITVPGPLRGRVMSVYTTVFAGSTPFGNGLTGAVGGLWGTSAALVMNGAIAFGAEAIAAVAVLRGHVPGLGAGGTDPGAASASYAGVGVPAASSKP
jgi:predicted MFS family arabinose efflux permease